ncbi:hypothetical protein AB1Y20_007425 [Prymnesium parvum]|uniref:Uncharacterized protein n=1 Tax=Prymnesium parvum TaxID=97485 RepID=A0AB34IUY9_PRYPA
MNSNIASGEAPSFARDSSWTYLLGAGRSTWAASVEHLRAVGKAQADGASRGRSALHGPIVKRPKRCLPS